MNVPILYEDNHVLVALKPRNMPVQADASGDTDLLSLLKGYIKEKYNKPGNVYLGLVHRLDRPVAGLVAFARTSKAAARLSTQLRDKRMGRHYLCVTQGETPERGSLRHFLLKDEKTNSSRAVPEGTPGAKEALLDFERLAVKDGLSLLRVQLGTGRSHQIRVQLKEAGFPLWGDNRYGGGRPGQSVALYAWELSFEHPTTREAVSLRAPFPMERPFDRFAGLFDENGEGESPCPNGRS